MHKILGINYSGFHDTAIAIVNTEGTILTACSLERITREKQDGKVPNKLLDHIELTDIEEIVITTNHFFRKQEYKSIIHPDLLRTPRDVDFSHKPEFYDFLKTLPISNISFIDHELAHAASAFWLSDFDEAVCLVYDGGMLNCNIFGGVYHCSKKNGINLIDAFDINKYAKITTLYTVITAMLGFTPNKHEGKVTGLAAYGKYDKECMHILNEWFTKDYNELESSLEWIFSYSQEVNPILHKHTKKLANIKKSFENFTAETIAYNLQNFSEKHILTIIENMHINGMLKPNICLAGGLFANVKINQKIADYESFTFNNIFIAPPMGDEGTALGAALHTVYEKYNIQNFHNSMYLGNSYEKNEIIDILKDLKIQYQILDNPSVKLAQLLADGNEVALFDLRMEFGPRALGARSILAPANDKSINDKLNQKLNRTEFMPFAPMTLEDFIDKSYINSEHKKHAMKFMTIACECSKWMAHSMPAVVHIDNTARPQIITQENTFLYEMIHEYNKLTGLSSIVNTSFNIHEEPIINTPYEAIKGALISGLNYLFFKEANILIKYEENKDIALHYIKERMLNHKFQEEKYIKMIEYFEESNNILKEELEKKEFVLQEIQCNLNHIQKQNEKHDNNFYFKLLKKVGLI